MANNTVTLANRWRLVTTVVCTAAPAASTHNYSKCNRNNKNKSNKTCSTLNSNCEHSAKRRRRGAVSRRGRSGRSSTARQTACTRAKKIIWFSVTATKNVPSRRKAGSTTGASASRNTNSTCSIQSTVSCAQAAGSSRELASQTGARRSPWPRGASMQCAETCFSSGTQSTVWI